MSRSKRALRLYINEFSGFLSLIIIIFVVSILSGKYQQAWSIVWNFRIILIPLLFLIIIVILRVKINGIIGEKSVAILLRRLKASKYKVINNIMLSNGERTSQIDHIIVSKYGVFVIETKNYSGWIYGDDYSQYWTQTFGRSKEKLYSPIRQNYGHIQTLKQLLAKFGDLEYIPLIVFTRRAKLKTNTKVRVIYTSQLLMSIKEYKDVQMTNDKVDKIFNFINKININSRGNRKKHIKNIQSDIFEKQNNVHKNICPRCKGRLVLSKGQHGSFLGCKNYPKCKFTSAES